MNVENMNVGDKVIITSGNREHNYNAIGEIVKKGRKFTVLTNGDENLEVSPDELFPLLEVGTKVRASGEEGVIDKIDEGDYLLYRVKFDNGDLSEWESVGKVKSVDSLNGIELKSGMVVEFADGDIGLADGDIGLVIMLSNELQILIGNKLGNFVQYVSASSLDYLHRNIVKIYDGGNQSRSFLVGDNYAESKLLWEKKEFEEFDTSEGKVKVFKDKVDFSGVEISMADLERVMDIRAKLINGDV